MGYIHFMLYHVSATIFSHTVSFWFQVKEYDSISRLDQWLTTILLRIKKGMNEEPDLT